MMRLILTALALMLALAACSTSDPDGEGATIVDDTTTAPDEPTEPAATTEAEDDGDAQGTRSNPVPLGTTVQLGDWQVTVTDVEVDATETVMAENEFNDGPVEGRQFVMATVEATYVGEDSGTFWTDLTYQFVGAGGNTFGSGSDDYCGVIPASISDTGETFPDASVSGNVCWSVPAEQVDGGTIAMESTFSFDSDRVFFATQ